MPIPTNKYRIKDYNQLENTADLNNKILEVESAAGTDRNFKVPFPQLVEGINNNLPAPLKTTHIIARTWDNTSPFYNSGYETFLSIIASRPLVHMMTARIEFPYPPKEYRLIYDPQGTYQAYPDSTFSGGLVPCSWVEIDSAEDVAAGIDYFNPFQSKYALGDAIKFNLSGSLRIFQAKQELVKSSFSTNQQPAPTGLISDVNWLEINGELAPNFSRLGQLECRFFANSERDAFGGDTLEDLIARENAGAGILYTKRQVTVELGPNAGTYEVAYADANPAFYAWQDGSFQNGRLPAKFVKVVQPAAAIAQNFTAIARQFNPFHPAFYTANEAIIWLLSNYSAPAGTFLDPTGAGGGYGGYGSYGGYGNTDATGATGVNPGLIPPPAISFSYASIYNNATAIETGGTCAGSATVQLSLLISTSLDRYILYFTPAPELPSKIGFTLSLATRNQSYLTQFADINILNTKAQDGRLHLSLPQLLSLAADKDGANAVPTITNETNFATRILNLNADGSHSSEDAVSYKLYFYNNLLLTTHGEQFGYGQGSGTEFDIQSSNLVVATLPDTMDPTLMFGRCAIASGDRFFVALPSNYRFTSLSIYSRSGENLGDMEFQGNFFYTNAEGYREQYTYYASQQTASNAFTMDVMFTLYN